MKKQTSMHRNGQDIEKEEKRIERREKKRRPTMRVSGRGTRELAKKLSESDGTPKIDGQTAS